MSSQAECLFQSPAWPTKIRETVFYSARGPLHPATRCCGDTNCSYGVIWRCFPSPELHACSFLCGHYHCSLDFPASQTIWLIAGAAGEPRRETFQLSPHKQYITSVGLASCTGKNTKQVPTYKASVAWNTEEGEREGRAQKTCGSVRSFSG